MHFNKNSFLSNLGGMLGGLFGHTDKPYKSGADTYKHYMDQSTGVQQPFYDAGKGALNDYQNWLQNQKDPTKFINDLMGGYSESPYAHYQQQQSINAAQNAGSASGLLGSTPLMEQIQQNASNISSKDMNQWLQNVLGINKQYGEGQNNLVNGGRDAANHLTDTYNNAGRDLGQATYSENAGKNNDFWNTISGGLGLIGSFL